MGNFFTLLQYSEDSENLIANDSSQDVLETSKQIMKLLLKVKCHY